MMTYPKPQQGCSHHFGDEIPFIYKHDGGQILINGGGREGLPVPPTHAYHLQNAKCREFGLLKTALVVVVGQELLLMV